MKITKEQLKQIVREELASLAEAKISPTDKKQFQSDAQEILDNFIKAKLVNAEISVLIALVAAAIALVKSAIDHPIDS